MTFELSKLLKYSSKSNVTYRKMEEELSPEEPGFRTLCPTRWTVMSYEMDKSDSRLFGKC